MVTLLLDMSSRTYGIEQHQHGATNWNRVENKVGRMGECNKNKRKTHEERWHVTAYDGRRSGGAGSNGFGMGDFQSAVHMLITRWRYG